MECPLNMASTKIASVSTASCSSIPTQLSPEQLRRIASVFCDALEAQQKKNDEKLQELRLEFEARLAEPQLTEIRPKRSLCFAVGVVILAFVFCFAGLSLQYKNEYTSEPVYLATTQRIADCLMKGTQDVSPVPSSVNAPTTAFDKWDCAFALSRVVNIPACNAELDLIRNNKPKYADDSKARYQKNVTSNEFPSSCVNSAHTKASTVCKENAEDFEVEFAVGELEKKAGMLFTLCSIPLADGKAFRKRTLSSKMYSCKDIYAYQPGDAPGLVRRYMYAQSEVPPLASTRILETAFCDTINVFLSAKAGVAAFLAIVTCVVMKVTHHMLGSGSSLLRLCFLLICATVAVARVYMPVDQLFYWILDIVANSGWAQQVLALASANPLYALVAGITVPEVLRFFL